MFSKKTVPFKISILVLFFVGILFPLNKTFADDQFDTSYHIIYEINEGGVTTVKQDIKIENKMADVLATTYSVTVREMDIYDVSGYDTKGALDINIRRDTEQNSIILSTDLNEKIIGKGRANELTITYKTKDLANKVGNIWNINLPKTANLKDVKSYEIEVRVPNVFGPKIFISPSPKETQDEGIYNIYKYSKEELSGETVTAAFGSNQTLNFKLNYHLENATMLPNRQEIALPPNIKGQQEIYYEKITPRPEKIRRDEDGNIMAIYKINPNSTLQIELRGSGKVLGRQINPAFGGKMDKISQSLIDKYTKEQKYWEISDPQIQKVARELFDPEKNVSENAQKAYEYVTENLDYNHEVEGDEYVVRNGALKALTQDKEWACMEFTDLFIALTRAMGIPSRELNGYAFTNMEEIAPISIDLNSGDLLHAWAEFYDPNFGWVPVDPTWGNTSGIDYFTKLDTNHLAFVIKGIESEYPFPAGSYRINPNDKQVNVDFAEQKRDFTPQVKVEKKFSWNLIKFIQGKRKYKLTHLEGPVLENLNGMNIDLLPFQSRSIYIDKDAKEVFYLDYNGVLKRLAL